MAEQQHEQAVGGQAATSAPKSAPVSSHPATSMVETMLSRGERAPRPFATIMMSHPEAQTEILALLHSTAGNAFVHEVTAAQNTNDEPAKAADVTLGPVRVTARALRIRSSASTANKKNVVGRLTRGTVVTPIAKDGDWLQIEHDGQTCFIHGDYVVSVVAPPKVVPEPKGEEAEEASEAEAAPPIVAPPPVAPPPLLPAAPAAVPDILAPPSVAPAAVPDAPPSVAPVAPPAAIPDTAATPTAAPKALPPIAPPVATPPLQTQKPPTTAPTPAPAPTPTPAPTTTSHDQAKPVVDQSDALGGTYKGVFSKIYSTGSQKSQVWVSEGGVSGTPNIYIHFHGHRTNYGIDDDLDWHEGALKKNKETGAMYQPAPKSHEKNVDVGGSGHRAAKEAMGAAQTQDTIVILPQGVMGEGGGGVHEGGYMKDLETLGLSAFIDKILKPLTKDLGLTKPLAPGNIALGGHSAGGYEGIHSAMRRLDDGEKDAALMDNITDVTLYDASYGSGAHLEETRTWAFHEGKEKKTTKNVRIVNGWAQQTEKLKGKANKAHDLWEGRFGEDNLRAFASTKGMTVRSLKGDIGQKLDNETKIMEHSQVIRKDGSVQADVLVVMFSAKGGHDHEPLRDRMIDDAIMSIGDGAAGNASFGRHEKGHLKEKVTAVEAAKHEEENDAHDNVFETPTAAATPENTPLPQPQHVDGDDRESKPEPVKPPPAAEKAAPKVTKQKKRDEAYEALREQLYDEKTGRVPAGKLSRKKNITDEQYEFKQKCYRMATSRIKPGKLFGGVDDEELAPIPGSDAKIRKEALSDLQALIGAAKAAGHHITVGSGYRAPEEDMRIWSSAFDRMYLRDTKKEREKRWPDDPYGDEAAAYLLDQIKWRKAPPGSSNHSNGIAVDFHAVEGGKEIPNMFKHQEAWRKSRVFAWLKANCGSHNFKNLASEAWHYDWKP